MQITTHEIIDVVLSPDYSQATLIMYHQGVPVVDVTFHPSQYEAMRQVIINARQFPADSRATALMRLKEARDRYTEHLSDIEPIVGASIVCEVCIMLSAAVLVGTAIWYWGS